MIDSEEPVPLHCICEESGCYCTKLVDLPITDPRTAKILSGSTDYELPCMDCQKGKHYKQINTGDAEKYVYSVVDSVAVATKRAMDASAATIILLPSELDGKVLLEIGLATLHDKPIVLVVMTDRDAISDRIKSMATEIVYTDKYQIKAPEFQELLGKAITRAMSKGRMN